MKTFASKTIELPPFIEDFDTLVLTDKFISNFEAFKTYLKNTKQPIKKLIIDGFLL
jgi:hypothetical protein